MQVATADKKQVFYSDNLDVVNFWVNQIDTARKFYSWYQDLLKMRYKSAEGKKSFALAPNQSPD